MKKIKKLLKMIFCLPLPWNVIIPALGFGAVFAVLFWDIREPVLRYGSYLASAYALAVAVFAAIPSAKRAKEWFKSTSVGKKYLSDIHLRNRVSLFIGITVNLVYIIIKLISGIVYRSEWFISLAVYYILLVLMKIYLISCKPKNDKLAELRRYRLCGFVLLIMNQTLAAMVVFMVRDGRHFSYPGYLIYAMAAYSFYAVITAAVSVVKTRKHQSPVLSATKAVSLVAAMVSILALTTAMLAQFGGDDPAFRRAMTGAVGGGVCAAVIGMAGYMIWRGNRGIREVGKG